MLGFDTRKTNLTSLNSTWTLSLPDIPLMEDPHITQRHQSLVVAEDTVLATCSSMVGWWLEADALQFFTLSQSNLHCPTDSCFADSSWPASQPAGKLLPFHTLRFLLTLMAPCHSCSITVPFCLLLHSAAQSIFELQVATQL